MKTLLILCCICASYCAYAQNWTPEQEQILSKFEVSKTDARSLKLVSSENQVCTVEYASVKEALDAFFVPHPMRDMEVFCVENFGNFAHVEGETLDMYHIVELYLETTSEK